MSGNNDKPYRYFKYEIPEPGEEVVVSGISGRYPESNSVEELKEKIFNYEDCITDDDRRWSLDHPEIPKRHGKINNIEKFDADFFNIGFKQAHTMDPMCRILLEHAYEAIVDAGVNPKDLRGKRVSVIVGSCFSESEKTWFYEKMKVGGYGIMGCSRSMLANRISQWLGVTGLSYTVDTACSSSIYAMEHAYKSIRYGQSDYAIVGGSNLCLHPFVSLQFSRLGVLSRDGICKSFDKDANGYTRSETVAVVFLQKARDAKRIYATFSHAKTNCDGYKEEGITFPSSERQSVLLEEFYEECGIPPENVHYIEAHGTGTRVGDPEELNAIDKVMCKNRTTPLIVGSIKANVGHTEPASGIVSLTKAIITLETGLIPPNIHFKNPRDDVDCFKENRIKVITEPTPLEGTYIGINSFGFGGANGHVLVQSHPKTKPKKLPYDDLPRLVVVSGRTEEAVESLLNRADKPPINVELVRLFHDIHRDEISGHDYRGYTVASRKTTNNNIREIGKCPNVKSPICFVFSGLGSEWPGMGQALMRFSVFAKAIEKCDVVLKPRKLNIYDILSKKDNNIFDNVLHSSIGIVAVQIGLVDLLTTVGVKPDYIIGHSIGELGCAYADRTLTLEEVMLAAYSRGVAPIQTKVPSGSMAVVDIGYKNVKQLCPADIDVVAHNGPDSCIVSGPTESIKALIKNLKANKISVQEVSCGNVPYHSRYIASAGPKLISYFKEIITKPKPRSEKWLSTSVPRNEWSTSAAKFSSAEYHANSLLKPVLFEETLALIPDNAVTIEIAPHATLTTILNKSLNSTITNIGLCQKDHTDNAEVFLQGLGKLYNNGHQLDLAVLYPPIEFPVSRGTPMISPSIRWDHKKDWYVTSFKVQEKIVSGERAIDVTIIDEDFEFITGHNIDGRNLFPATGYLGLVWETIGMMVGQLYTEVSVVFRDVKFIRATTIPKEGRVEMTVMIQKGSGNFEVIEGNTAVVSGNIRIADDITKEKVPEYARKDDVEREEILKTKDIYKELRLRGYQYSGLFKSFVSASIDGRRGHIEWKQNWVAFMDNLLQLKILTFDTRGLFVPTGIKKLVIDTKYHQQYIRALPLEEQYIPVQYCENLDVVIGGGIEVHNILANAIARKRPAGDPVIEEYRFVAHRDKEVMSLRDILTFSLHICLENILNLSVKTNELIDENDNVSGENLASPLISDILGNLPLIQANINVFALTQKYTENEIPENITISEPKKLQLDDSALLSIGCNLLSSDNTDKLQQLIKATKPQGFILSRENINTQLNSSILKELQLGVVAEKRTSDEYFVLLRKLDKNKVKLLVFHVDSNEFNWLEKVKNDVDKEIEDCNSNFRVILVEQGKFESGLMGFINCLIKEPGCEMYRAVLIQDTKAPKFSLDLPLYSEQIELNLTINVLRSGEVWGSYRHFLLPPIENQISFHGLISQQVRGDLNSICWVKGTHKPIDEENLIKIHYSSLNFKDVMLATGKLAAEVITDDRKLLDYLLGFEYSGITAKGERVMGYSFNGCLSNYTRYEEYSSWKIPEDWSLEEAASVPCVYATCITAFYLSGNIQKGQSILIHAGTGGIGQAAINLALHQGLEVFTTVGTPEKREFIKKMFPSIDDNHIGNSRDTSFEQMILRETNGRGVDYVLNSLAEEKLKASLRCVAYGGIFLEIGKFDIASNNTINADLFQNNISFHAVMLDKIIVSNNYKLKKEIRDKLYELIACGAVKPINRQIFQKDQVEEALRFMAAGKHMGKILIQIRKDNDPPNMTMTTVPTYLCDPDKSYVIIGGLGGFGLELIDWLILRNAKNVVITSRNGIKNGYQRLRVKLWESYGVKVKILVNLDAGKREDCELILKTAIDLGPVDGIFNLAASLRDGIFKNQTIESFEESFKGKAWPTKCLDEVSRKLCPDLQHFVVFSSVSCGRGNAGQTNYGMANSVMERICEKRVAEGLPGLAIQWGAIGDVGLVADLQEDDKEMVIGGTLQQKISSCLKELNGFLLQKKPVVASMVVAEKRAGFYGTNNCVDCVLGIMGIKDLKTVSQQTSLAELGMDSMMAVEIKQTLEREFEIFLTAQDIRNLNFAKLIEMNDVNESKSNNNQNSSQEESVTKMVMQLFGETLSKDIIMPLKTNPEEGRKEIFFIPGIEGYGVVFKNLESKIKSPATCFQIASRYELKSFEDMANFILPHLLKKLDTRKDFTLVGYSYGTIISIEIARQLERKGYNVKLILIDGSPLHMKEMMNYLNPSSVKEMEKNILFNIADSIDPIFCEQLMNKLDNSDTWEEKVKLFIEILPREYKKLMSDQECKDSLNSYYIRMKALASYNVDLLSFLKAPIKLCKPTLASVQNINHEYGLQNVTQNKIEVYTIEGNHITILGNEKLAKIINDELIEEDLETPKSNSN
ncbi:PREDICTED: fatty acid synthase [Polistes dominula]|uniref:Fatty acid synthase n=1 Tax=Polistes dominula TaxID=743375 RepID=A0ABM1IFL5_POLDO|nr:PREDICTED: fatty acid synthase [Polistes dominula]